MTTIGNLEVNSNALATCVRTAWALLLCLALTGGVLQAAPLTEADIIERLQATSLPNTQEVDPDDVFANDAPPGKNLGRVRLPDTKGACLDDQAQSIGHRALVVIPLAPPGAPQVDLTLQFAFGKYQLTKADEQQLNIMVTALNSEQLRHARFTISGHTDDIGQVQINQKLSCARSLSARAYLINAGIAENRLSAYGFGSSRPVAGKAANAPENRRVEFRRAEN